MTFKRKIIVVCMSSSLGHSFFNTLEDALEHLSFLKKKYKYETFKVFEEVPNAL